MVPHRLRTVSQLWASGIKAETLYNDNPKPQKQLDYAFESGIPLIIWLGEDEVNQGVFKVKQLNSGQEDLFEFSLLVEKMKELVALNPVFIPKAKDAA